MHAGKSAHTEAGGSVTSHRPAVARGEGGRRREENKDARSPTAAVQTFFETARVENITKHTTERLHGLVRLCVRSVWLCAYMYMCAHRCVASSETGCEDLSGLILPDVIHMLVSNGRGNNTHSDTNLCLLFN